MQDIQRDQSSLGHFPRTEHWTFDESVTSVFPDMLKRSIPQYDVMRQAVFDLGKHFVHPGTTVVDLGCSVGDSLHPFVAYFGANNRYIGIETSQPMIEIVSDKFAAEISSAYLEIHDLDLRCSYPQVKASLTLCVLTLQFIPLEFRQRILADIYSSTLPGGALILVEKVVGATALLHQQFADLYHVHKNANGYSWHEIETKRRSLENVLVPLTARWNEALLREAGFCDVDIFWKWMNFAGVIAVKR